MAVRLGGPGAVGGVGLMGAWAVGQASDDPGYPARQVMPPVGPTIPTPWAYGRRNVRTVGRKRVKEAFVRYMSHPAVEPTTKGPVLEFCESVSFL